MTDEFRKSEQHFTDISAVAGDLGKRLPALPLFLVGTSRGSVSAAALGARFGPQAAGVVLTASMFRPARPRSNEPGQGLSGFDFATIQTALLFVHHVSDQCVVTPYGDAARLVDRYPLITVFGGRSQQSDPCEARSAHGFFGKEPETVEQIVNWMLKRPFQEQVK
jgi:pimeloyl-ACP methyl ester carboxylesterase